jgi:hypothetical protein
MVSARASTVALLSAPAASRASISADMAIPPSIVRVVADNRQGDVPRVERLVGAPALAEEVLVGLLPWIQA